jgi:hypothetical protein
MNTPNGTYGLPPSFNSHPCDNGAALLESIAKPAVGHPAAARPVLSPPGYSVSE